VSGDPRALWRGARDTRLHHRTLQCLVHESGGSREAAQHLHALDLELQHEAAPKIDALVLRLDPDLDFGIDWFLARLTGVVDELLGSQRHDGTSQDHGGVAGQ
jgi:hypothetical protein